MARAQSAMEYLMTYGWAILIIAIVLAALFQLGVFNSTNFAPKAPPGSCQVFRPNGPGSTQFISTEGLCNGELPQYVANIRGTPIEGIHIPYLGSNFSESVWYLDQNPSGSYYGCGPNAMCSTPVIDVYNASTNGGYGGGQNLDFGGIGADAGTSVTWACTGWPIYCPQISSAVNGPKIWYNIVITVKDGNIGNLYINGNPPIAFSLGLSSANWTTIASYMKSPTVSIGSNPPGGDEESSGLLVSNLQLYNTTLSQNDITTLYQEGIGGAPIDLQNLVGWWPLNGNANDYSGNGYNGNAISVAYTGAWTSGYTQP